MPRTHVALRSPRTAIGGALAALVLAAAPAAAQQPSDTLPRVPAGAPVRIFAPALTGHLLVGPVLASTPDSIVLAPQGSAAPRAVPAYRVESLDVSRGRSRRVGARNGLAAGLLAGAAAGLVLTSGQDSYAGSVAAGAVAVGGAAGLGLGALYGAQRWRRVRTPAAPGSAGPNGWQWSVARRRGGIVVVPHVGMTSRVSVTAKGEIYDAQEGEYQPFAQAHRIPETYRGGADVEVPLTGVLSLAAGASATVGARPEHETLRFITSGRGLTLVHAGVKGWLPTPVPIALGAGLGVARETARAGDWWTGTASHPLVHLSAETEIPLASSRTGIRVGLTDDLIRWKSSLINDRIASGSTSSIRGMKAPASALLGAFAGLAVHL